MILFRDGDPACRVTIADIDGVAHTVEVTAHPLSEALALDLKQMQGTNGL
jgi:hypothetical protein